MAVAAQPLTRGRSAWDLFPYAAIAPALTVTFVLSIGPLCYGLWLSLQDWYLLASPKPVYQGLAGYLRLAQDAQFWNSFWRTLVWTGGTVAIEVALGLGFALLLDRPTRVAQWTSALILLPWATPSIVAAYGWQFLLSPDAGGLFRILRWIGLAGTQSPLGDPDQALATLILISGWKGTPFMVVSLLAALRGIPTELIEAAGVDGASTVQRFRFVVWPLIRNQTVVTSVLLGLLAFYSFDLPWIMTQGGPGEATTIVGIRVYQAIFVELQPSYAATMSSAILSVLFVTGIMLMQLRRTS